MASEIKKERCVKLRTATPADLQGVLGLLTQAGLPTEGVDTEALRDFVIAEYGDTAVGVVGLEVYRESALLRSAAVEESWRGRGVGGALVDRALRLSADRARNSGDKCLRGRNLLVSARFRGHGARCQRGELQAEADRRSHGRS